MAWRSSIDSGSPSEDSGSPSDDDAERRRRQPARPGTEPALRAGSTAPPSDRARSLPKTPSPHEIGCQRPLRRLLPSAERTWPCRENSEKCRSRDSLSPRRDPCEACGRLPSLRRGVCGASGALLSVTNGVCGLLRHLLSLTKRACAPPGTLLSVTRGACRTDRREVLRRNPSMDEPGSAFRVADPSI